MKFRGMSFLLIVCILTFGIGAVIASAGTITLTGINGEDVDYWYIIPDPITSNQDRDDQTTGELLFTSNDYYITSGYCVELAVPIWGETPFDVEFLPLSSISSGYEVAWLVHTYGSIADTSEEKAGLQLAIWETMYGDNFLYSDSQGVPVFDAFSSYLDGLAQNYPSNGFNGGGYQVASLTWTNNAGQIFDVQDVIVKVVPEPTTMFLMGLGLLGLAGIVRKKIIAKR